ncbi:IucA/IucC family C-terminal-domain containing protein [Ureibacillus composti]
MLNVLTNQEIEQLKQFRFTTEQKPSALSISLDELLNEQKLLSYLEQVKTKIGSPNLKVAASIFMKRYSFLAVIYFYGISVWNKKLDISFQNVSLQSVEADQWIPQFYFHHLHTELANENREVLLEKWIQFFFSENATVLISNLSKVTKQSELILWENLAIYLFWLYESVLVKIENEEELRTRAKEDFQLIVNGSAGLLFGNDQDNPIKRFYCDKRCLADSQEEVRVRKTCCLTYLLDGGCKTCKTCPRTCCARAKV